MAPRASWKGLLVFGRVGCPVRLHAAAVRAERLGFQPLNRATLNRLQMRPHDPQTGKEVTRDAVVRGYEVEPGQFVPLEERELLEIELDSTRSLVIGRFVARGSIDPAFIDAPYFLLPDGRGTDPAYAVLREAMRRRNLAAVSRLVLGGRERAVVIETRGRSMLLTTLRASHEVRVEEPILGEPEDTPPDEATIELAERVIARLTSEFDPRRDFRDRYQEALFHFVQAKRRGEKPTVRRPPAPAVISDLQEALETSLAALSEAPATAGRPEPQRRSARSA
jgi:DNA end-binding protein Ku